MNRPVDFSTIHNDLLAYSASIIPDNKDYLRLLTKKHHRIEWPSVKVEHNDHVIELDVFQMDFKTMKPIKFQPWKQQRIVQEAKNKNFDYSVFDGDINIIAGGFRWDIKKMEDGMLHFQFNDTWDLHPLASRGRKYLHDNGYDYSKEAHISNIEALKLLGGKPYNIQNNFIVDPTTYEIIHQY